MPRRRPAAAIAAALAQQGRGAKKQRVARRGPKSGGCSAGDKRAILLTAAVWLPPRHEFLVATELLDASRPWPPPMIFKPDIHEEARAEHQARQQKYDGAARNEHFSARQDQFDRKRGHWKGDQYDLGPESDFAYGQNCRFDPNFRHAAAGLAEPEEEARDRQIDVRGQTKDKPGSDSNRQDNK